MMVQLTGTIEYQEIGIGTWALLGDDGVTYELFNPPAALQQAGQTVNISGQIRDDVMSLAMIGPVLEVQSYSSTP